MTYWLVAVPSIVGPGPMRVPPHYPGAGRSALQGHESHEPAIVSDRQRCVSDTIDELAHADLTDAHITAGIDAHAQYAGI